MFGVVIIQLSNDRLVMTRNGLKTSMYDDDTVEPLKEGSAGRDSDTIGIK